jgi:hypothetical protein
VSSASGPTPSGVEQPARHRAGDRRGANGRDLRDAQRLWERRAALREWSAARAAAQIGKVLGAGSTGILLIVCLAVAFTAIGSNYVSTTSGQTACRLPGSTGCRGVEVFRGVEVLGDSTLLGLAGDLPSKIASGKVVDDVKAGRTAQQGENGLNTLPGSA